MEVVTKVVYHAFKEFVGLFIGGIDHAVIGLTTIKLVKI